MYVYPCHTFRNLILPWCIRLRDKCSIGCLHYDRVVAKVNERYHSIINGEPTVPYKAYEALRERHTSLTQQYTNLQNAHNKTIEKWRLAKAHIKTWETYHERCKARERAKNERERVAERGRRHDPDIGATEVEEPISHDGPRHDAQLNLSALPLLGSNRSVISPQRGLARPPKARNNRSNATVINNIPEQGVERAEDRGNLEASIHRDDEIDGRGHGVDELPTPKRGDRSHATAGKPLRLDISGYSSDQPVIVSERSLKKRKRQSNVHTPGVSVNEDVQEVGSVAKPIHVKSENNSSSPAPAAGRREELVMQDSLDLDDVGARLITPRKRRRLQELLRLSQSNPLAAGAGVRVGQSAQGNQPLEGPLKRSLVIKANTATKPSETRKQDRASLFQGTRQPTSGGDSTGPCIEPEKQLNAAANVSTWKRPNGWLEASPTFQRPKQPLRTLNGNILRPQSPQQINSPAEIISLEAPSTPENSNDHKRLTSQSSKDDDQPVRAYSAAPKGSTSNMHHSEKPTTVKAELAKVLQPTNPNAQIQPRTSEPTSTSKGQNHKNRRDRITDRMPLVTEDGENFSENNLRRGAKPAPGHGLEETRKPLRQHDQEKVDLQVHRRLASLLDEPSPEKALLSSTSPSNKATKAISKSPSRPSAQSRQTDNGSLDLGKLRTTTSTPNRGPSPTYPTGKGREPRQIGEKPVVEDKRPSLAGQHQPPTSSNNEDPDAIDPDHEPLRARPLHRLGPDDFKINPNNNQGLDYAFTEVVRNHDQRKCLPGCTRPSCCGSAFRKLVEIGGFPNPRTSGLWSSSPSDDKDQDTQDQADARLLKEYLGADHERRLKGMSEADKKEALLSAKTRAFADQHGRHRQAFERRATPPGFWRTDMPSTQEVEMDREEARVLERKRVEDMHREAMREGGRWRFRDE